MQQSRRRRKRGHRDRVDALEVADGAEAAFHGCGEELFLVVLVGAIVVVLILFGWPLLVLLIDFAWLVGVLIVWIAARVIFRRPWRVEATDDGGERHVWLVVGFRAAGRQRDEVVASLVSGAQPSSMLG